MCMCDNDNNYVCFECEEFLKDAVKDLIHKFKNEILDTGDWWYAVNTVNNKYDINVFCLDDDNFDKPDTFFSINLYRLNYPDGTSSYESSVQWDMQPMTRREIRLL